MKAVYLSTNNKQFKENYKEALLGFYGDKTEVVAENDTGLIFKIPFAQEYFAFIMYHYSYCNVGAYEDIGFDNIYIEPDLFQKDNRLTIFNLLILKDNSITLLQGDSNTTYGGQSIYSILNTDKGLVFFSCCASPGNIEVSKSLHIESNSPVTPITFGNEYIKDKDVVYKKPLEFINTLTGEVYTALDIYNISYKPDNFTALPKSFISSWNLASKDNPQEPIMTSLLIYDEEEENE